MKLFKVGSSPSCDIVIQSEFVSNHHADITVLDSGEILIEDKNSRNGTFVGVNGTKIQPNHEVSVHRGDRVVFGNAALDWNKVPQANSYPRAKRIVNIGSNQRNDIVVPGSAVSRYHATLVIDKDGHAMLVDNKSTNGTKVNGQKLVAGRPTRIKRGDNVIVGEEDITAQLESYLPSNKTSKTILSIVAGLAVLVGVGYGSYEIYKYLTKREIDITDVTVIPDSAIVMIRNVYHYELEPSDNPYKLPIKFETDRYSAYGTGFFIDEEGRIGTNRHVAAPWHEEYQDRDWWTNLKIQEELAQYWDQKIKNSLPYVTEEDYYSKLSKSEIGRSILEATQYMRGDRVRNINNLIERIRTTPPKITGKSDDLSVAYANRHYTAYNQFEPAVMIGESGDKDKDVAIIQLNTGETPAKIVRAGIFDVNRFFTGKPKVMDKTLEFKGFPDGLARTYDEHFNSFTNAPTTYQGKVSRNADPYNFEIQASTTHGASGSPVYHKGVLYGLVAAGHSAGDDVIIAPAKFLKDLYAQKVLPYREKEQE